MLKRRINLLSEGYIPPKVTPSFQHLITTIAVIITFSVILYTTSFYMIANAKREHDGLALQLAKNQEKQALYERSLAENKVDSTLLKKVELAEERIEIKQLLLNRIDGESQTGVEGFSQIMMDLAAINHENVWLTEISINDMQVNFKGLAVSGADVPRWIDLLQYTQSLSGKSFKSITIEQGEDKPVQFILKSLNQDKLVARVSK